MSEHTQAIKTNLGEAGTHLKQAASAAGGAVKNAANAAGGELKQGSEQVKAELSGSATAGRNAASHIGDATSEQVDALMEKGRDLIDSAAELIRERPLAAFGVAFAAGWIISKLGRSDK